MQFKDILGQETIKARLRACADEGRIPHAQLFWGIEGCGKTALALAFAQYINCTNRHDGDSCGECPSCKQMKKGVHPDVHFLFPYYQGTGDSCEALLPAWRDYLTSTSYPVPEHWFARCKAEGKQCIIYSKESEALIDKTSLKTFQSPYKVIFVWMPERMHETLANKLLKFLEEPPEGTVFLLVSSNPDALLQTILSRTQSVHVPPIEQSLLASQFPEEIARIASGSYTQAALLQREDVAARTNFDSLRALLNAVVLRDIPGLKAWSETMSKAGREPVKKFLIYTQHMLREALMANLGQPELLYHSPYEDHFINKFKQYIHTNNIEALCQQLELAGAQIGQNANIKTVLTDMGLQFFTKIK